MSVRRRHTLVREVVERLGEDDACVRRLQVVQVEIDWPELPPLALYEAGSTWSIAEDLAEDLPETPTLEVLR